MQNSKQISVIIRTKNEERWIGHTIQSVLDFIPSSEIIIVDNNSSDGTLNMVRHFIQDPTLDTGDYSKYTDIKIFNIKDYTPGKSLNLGIKNSSNEICVILSAHCVISKFNINKHKDDLNNFVCIFGNQIPVWNGKKITKRYIWSHFKDKECVNMYSELEDRYFLHNAISIYNKSYLIECPFDEYLQSKEDRYWAMNAIKNQKKILYDPALEVFHHFTQNGYTWNGNA